MPDNATDTPPAPAAAEPNTPPAATGQATDQTPAAGNDAFKSQESKSSVLADLAKERDARQALEARIEAQNKALGAALGLTEPPKNEGTLAETVKALQEQVNASQLEATKLRTAAEFDIPAEHHDLLTETDPEKLRAQAEKVAALVKASTAATPPTPPHLTPNPGQGQGGQPLSDEAKDNAEYELFYPSKNRK